MEARHNNLWRRFISGAGRYFLAGITVVVPVVATVMLLVFVFNRLDGALQAPVGAVIRWFKPGFRSHIPGLGLVTFVLLTFITGLVASNYIGKRVITAFESLLVRIPVFSQMYRAARQMTRGITGNSVEKAAFRRVVYIQFPFKGVICAAFVTNELKDQNGNKLYALYIATPPSPFTGYFLIVEADAIIETGLAVDDALKMELTAGIISPPYIDAVPNPFASAP